MRTCVALLLIALVAVPAFAEVLTLNGTLAGDPMPEGYKFELSAVGIQDNKPVLEVVGKSCAKDDDRSCQRTTIRFALPEGFSIANKKAYYQKGDLNLWIGNVANLGQTQWIALRKGAVLEATLTAARLKLDTAQLSSLTQVDRFEELHTVR